MKEWNDNFFIFIMALSAGLTTISRPEGIILIFVIFLIYFLPHIFMSGLKKTLSKRFIPAVIILAGLALINIPLLFIEYGTESQSGNAWYKTLHYNSEAKNFESAYFPWTEFNYALARENLSDNPSSAHLLNSNINAEIISHPFASAKWLLTETVLKLTVFPSIYFDFNKWGIHIPIITAIIMSAIIIGPIWEVGIFICLFVLGFSLLTPVIYIRQALVLSPLILSAFFLTFDRICTKLCKKNTVHTQKKSAFIFILVIISALISLIIFQAEIVINIVRHYENNKYTASVEAVKNHTDISSIIVSDYPQLINLMTERVSLGASNILDILNPKIERYHPDYILINDCRVTQSYTRFITGDHPEAYRYITQNYAIILHNHQEHTLLFRHR